MSTELENQQRAAQLRKPDGEEGIMVAEWMNKGNRQMNLDTIKILNPSPNDNILEIGMGNGHFVPDILSVHSSIHYTGCDFSEDMIEESKKRNASLVANGQAKFILTDVASLPFSNKYFSKIFTINTIYFWEDRNKILEELLRVLKPEGQLIIALRPKHQAEKYPFAKYGFTLYSKEDLESFMKENNITNYKIIANHEPDFEVNGEMKKMENLILIVNT
jgi:ubiquinone/menaquinone biosynthesis C-methylase UbiE